MDCNMATRKQISSDYSCGGCGNDLPGGKDKGKHSKSKSSPGCVIILNDGTAAEQQPHRALSASATKAADGRHQRRWCCVYSLGTPKEECWGEIEYYVTIKSHVVFVHE